MTKGVTGKMLKIKLLIVNRSEAPVMKQRLLTTIAAVVLVGCGPSAAELALIGAANDGNIEAVKQHLAAGTDANAKDKYGTTPLHRAAEKGHKEVVALLIAKGADVNAMTNTGWTSLHFAALKGRKEIAELLLASGADVNAKDKTRGGTPLHYAAISPNYGRGHKEIAELLITKGADVNAKADDGGPPLDWAMQHPETADLLRKHGAKTGEELKAEQSLIDAAESGNIEAVKQSIADGTDVELKCVNCGGTVLSHAAVGGHKEIVELLISQGADVNAKGKHGRISLHAAAAKGHKGIAELLIANGADVNAKNRDGDTPLYWAIEENHAETADLLRKHGGKTKEELN